MSATMIASSYPIGCKLHRLIILIYFCCILPSASFVSSLHRRWNSRTDKFTRVISLLITPTSSKIEAPSIRLDIDIYDNNSTPHIQAGIDLTVNSLRDKPTQIMNYQNNPLVSSERSGNIKIWKQLRYALDFSSIVMLSFVLSVMLISWEDLTCKFVLPSRHRTSISLYQPSAMSAWGMSTINGMGFGQNERQLLMSESESSNVFEVDPQLNVPSYNEVMLFHRTVTIPQWKRKPSSSTIAVAIHTVIESMQQLDDIRTMTNNYQWDEIRNQLYSAPFSDLSLQSSVLRQLSNEINDVIGFDWGSCAWRHCGAISDIQEAIDEIDQLLGVLEPYEIIFCIDIIERSLRDILSVIPLQEYASNTDIEIYAHLQPYIPSNSNSIDATDRVDDDEVSALSRIDESYFRTLQELRID